MKHTVSILVLIAVFVLSFGSCNQKVISSSASFPLTALTNPKDWNPPVFPGAVRDSELYANMTAVAVTPGAIDETACDCFGFPVHDAVFHAYRSLADPQEVMDFYSKQMKAD